MEHKKPFIWDVILSPHDKKQKILDKTIDSSFYADIAQWLNIVAIKDLKVRLQLQRVDTKNALLDGKITAKLVQSCIISLEDIPENLHFSFERNFTDKLETPNSTHEEDWENLDSEQELWDGKTIDIAQVILEELALNMNSYPKKEGVTLEAISSVDTTLNIKEGEVKQDNPFAALKNLDLKK
ncbi:MAG: YceD family protein [Alphaproteobacteria bacterium]